MSEWKDKYLKLSADHEQEVAQCEENEQLLCRAIVRLTIAVNGLDKRLDPHLKSLQTAAKGGKVTPAFRHRLAELSDALVKAGEEPVPEVPDLLGRLVASSQLKGRQQKQLDRLYQRLLEDPAKATPAELNELLSLLAPAGANGEAAPARGGMFGRLLGGAPGAEPDAPQPNRQLIELMRRLDWPARLRSDVDAIRDRLEGNGVRADAWLGVVEELSKLFSANIVQVESDIKETERFLSGLNTRLQELDAVLSRIDTANGQTMESGRVLRAVMVKEVDGVKSDADAATDLQAFKTQLSKRLDVIQNQVVQHLREEQQRFEATSQESAQMHQRLKELEAEGNKLRQALAEAENQATTDALTGVPNRAAFERRMVEEYARWQRFGEPLCLLVWDIDHFKSINDNFGHQAGDKALRAIGQMLAKQIRKTDFLARYGGEEFVMLMPGTHAEQAGTVANTIREGVAQKPFMAGEKRIPLTLSCGYCEFRPDEQAKEAFQRADAALYKAKQNGRNRCEEG